MRQKGFFWLIFALVTFISWIDQQYFTEGHALQYTAFTRQVGHTITLICIVPIGYMGWKNHPVKWFGRLWLYSYLLVIGFITIIGTVQWKTGYFTTELLDSVSSMRIFFCSPVPSFMLYIMHRVLCRNGSGS